MGEANILQVDELEQACEGSTNEDHFANNQKCARNVKRTIKTDMALFLVESFAIAILDTLIDCEFPSTHGSLPRTTLSLIASPSILKE